MVDFKRESGLYRMIQTVSHTKDLKKIRTVCYSFEEEEMNGVWQEGRSHDLGRVFKPIAQVV
jgi:hypothetical protein